MKQLALPAALALACLAAPAQALVIVDSSGALAASDPQQLGRLFRQGPPSDWSTDKPFPGTTNAAVSYAYDAIAIPFAANATQDIYYQIEIDDPSALLFASGYNGAYNPVSLMTNYKGDEGVSGNPFPEDESFFQIKIPAGGSLTLVLNQTQAGSFTSYSYIVEAFSSTEYDAEFGPTSAAPEPGTWALMIAGVGLAGAVIRRGRREPSLRSA